MPPRRPSLKKSLRAIKTPPGTRSQDRVKSNGRIDGIVALIIALGRSNVNGSHGSTWEWRGMICQMLD